MPKKLSQLLTEADRALDKFELEVQKPIKAQKGGDTWKEVVRAADGIKASLRSPMASIELMLKSKDPKDKLKIPVYQKQITAQLAAVKLGPVTKYQAEHGPGGSKQRTSLLRTSSSKAEEAKRVQLCADLVEQAESLKKIAIALAASKDFS